MLPTFLEEKLGHIVCTCTHTQVRLQYRTQHVQNQHDRNVDQTPLGDNCSEPVLLHNILVFPAADGCRNNTLLSPSLLERDQALLVPA